MVLNEYIRHFEPLFYDHHDLRQQHARTKRHADGELRVRFNAHNRYPLHLKSFLELDEEKAASTEALDYSKPLNLLRMALS